MITMSEAGTRRSEPSRLQLLRLLRTQDERLGLDRQENRRPCNHRHAMEATCFRPHVEPGWAGRADMERVYGRPV